MPPQVCDLWPESIRAAFGDMYACGRQGDMTGVARGCKRIEAKLKKLEAASPARAKRVKIARSHYDLSFFYKDLPARYRQFGPTAWEGWCRVERVPGTVFLPCIVIDDFATGRTYLPNYKGGVCYN